MPINVLYHDVTAVGDENASGFAGPEATRYKLNIDDFEKHLAAIAGCGVISPLASVSALNSATSVSGAWTITFDDGGASSATIIADRLERHGWRGWFFVPTDFIGRSGFCNADDIRRLHHRGHVIGSH